MVDAQSFEDCRQGNGQLHGSREEQAVEEVLVPSDHPARGRATKRLTSCPQLTSHDRTLEDASSLWAGKPKKKCSEAAIARPPVCRTLEQAQSEIRESNFQVLAPGHESKRSQSFDLQKVYNGGSFTPGLLLAPLEARRWSCSFCLPGSFGQQDSRAEACPVFTDNWGASLPSVIRFASHQPVVHPWVTLAKTRSYQPNLAVAEGRIMGI